MEYYFFLKNYVTSEEAISLNVLYYQPLPITRNQEKFYDNNYFNIATAFELPRSLNHFMLVFLIRPGILEFQLWKGKAILMLQRALPSSEGNWILLKGHQGQDQGQRGAIACM